MHSRTDDQLKRASDPGTEISKLIALLVDFPGNVLRNPALAVAIVADPSLIRGLDLPRRAIMALDAEYRKFALPVAPAGFEEVVMFCDRQCGKLFRFAPLTRKQLIDYTPFSQGAPQAPSPELVTALRFASALMPALTRTPGTEELTVWKRTPADSPPLPTGRLPTAREPGGHNCRTPCPSRKNCARFSCTCCRITRVST